jgi:hypothetical protein
MTALDTERFQPFPDLLNRAGAQGSGANGALHRADRNNAERLCVQGLYDRENETQPAEDSTDRSNHSRLIARQRYRDLLRREANFARDSAGEPTAIGVICVDARPANLSHRNCCHFLPSGA